MAREIDPSLLNYNKFPGKMVIALPDETVKVGEKTFKLLQNFKDGFEALALEQRYSDLFAKYDFIVGDWSHELLRLKGFYQNNKKAVAREDRIDHLSEYLQEYCSYGCAYFVLERERKEGEKDDEAFVRYSEDEKPIPKSKNQNRLRENSRGRKDRHRENEFSEMTTKPRVPSTGQKKTDRPAGKNRKKKPENTNSRKNINANQTPKNKKNSERRSDSRPKFTIRNRED